MTLYMTIHNSKNKGKFVKQIEVDFRAMSDLGNRLAQLVIEKFNNLKLKSGKPTIRSNGVREWTVLAGVVAVIDNEEELVICLATGVKAMPNKYRSFSNGLIVHDMHAEMLCLRLFNWYLLDECIKLKESSEYQSKLFERTNGKFKLKGNVRLGLFISEPPCGDASMSLVSEQGGESWNELKEEDPPQELDSENDEQRSKSVAEPSTKRRKVVRGREYFNQLGLVRTKPGRADSEITYSKSCSDKLCLKQLVGINNCLTSRLCEPIFLDFLLIDESKFNEDDFNRCFSQRFTIKLDKVHALQCVTFNNSSAFEFAKPENKKDVPSQLSLLCVVPGATIQVLNNGVKNGSFVKNKAPKPGRESFICNQQLYSKSIKISPILSDNYDTYKRSLLKREDLKYKGRALLENWNPTDKDNFVLWREDK